MSAVVQETQLQQRADYTYKFNVKSGRHGWLRLTPAYSVKIVEELVMLHREANRIFDPFCGTGTTALSAAYHGHQVMTTDINPFLVWLASSKSAHYSGSEIAATRQACDEVVDAVQRESIDPAPAPPIFNIERWWNPKVLLSLRLLLGAIEKVSKRDSQERSLLRIAFCRTLISQSNAAFDHQSMSFKNDDQLTLELDTNMSGAFAEDVRFVLAGAAENPSGSACVLFGDSRMPSATVKGPFDLVITSPPYANRMSYIRELRPYMYWLGFLETGRDAGEMDWTAIGGTWGIATSRLTGWERTAEHFQSKRLTTALDEIASAGNKNGALLAKYVTKYFDDMWTHFKDLTNVLAPHAELHYIVGNSTFYGSLISTELLYAEMLSELGFCDIKCQPIRKRNSKKELVEFDVVARWKGS